LIGLIAIAVFIFVLRKQSPSPKGATASKIQSLAVLPLTNLSGDPQQEYFSDGMTEALITDLAKIRALKVISRTSVVQFKQTTKPLPEIARELGVEAIVEGSVMRAGNRVRITAQLVDASTDRHLWAESYERDLSDVLTLQSEVASAIANQIQATLTPQERSRLTASHRVNPDAHEAYLKGRYFWGQWTPEGFRKAIEYFQQATAHDPNYGAAYAGLADCYSAESEYGMVDPKDAAGKAEAAALKALQLDETLADAHVSLGLVNEKYKWDWASADRELRRAVELQPGSARAHLLYARYLAEMRRLQESIAEIKRARELDPLSAVTNATMAMIFFFSRQYDQAIDQCRATLEIDSNFLWAYHLMGEDYIEKGMYKEALAALQKSISSEINPHFEAIIGYANARAGNRQEALKVITKLENTTGEYVPPTQIALIYGGLNEKDQAFALLERAFTERDSSLIDIYAAPYFEPLRSDARFQALLRRMNLPQQ
jgi:TolB-like protein/Flp pilus assembly protein TadD